jgi:hypothetical protein
MVIVQGFFRSNGKDRAKEGFVLQQQKKIRQTKKEEQNDIE